MLKAGIIGLPTVGKTTLFNALTNSTIKTSAYSSSAKNPNIGIVDLVDERVNFLASIYKPKKIVYTNTSFIDIAGIVKGGTRDGGMSTQLLSNIREVDVIVHVVRAFLDENIIHTSNIINPINDIEAINMELKLADLEVVKKRIDKIGKKAALLNEYKLESTLLNKLQDLLSENENIVIKDLDEEETSILKGYNLLSIKPIVYVINIDEAQLLDSNKIPKYEELKSYMKDNSYEYVFVACKIESELVELDTEDKEVFLKEYNIKESSLNLITKKTYDLIGLKTFLTAGPDECRAWTFKGGMNAKRCAGVIHSDFEKGFIKAEVVSFDDFKLYGSNLKAKENGRLRLEGKDYLMQDGDIVEFRFNI